MLPLKQIKNPRIISMVGREIAGYHSNLQRGFDQLGVENYFFYERTHQFYKHTKSRTTLEKWISALNDFIFNPKNGKVKKIALFALIYPFAYILKIALFPLFLKKYDVFIFSANYSYLGLHIDRLILKLLNKVTVDIALGSEARPPYLNGIFQDESLQKIKFRTASKKRKINRKTKYTTYLVDHPTTSQFNTRPYIPLLYMGLPFYLPETDAAEKMQKRPLILHAPSSPKIKGTSIIRQVIDELKEEGKYDFDYKELIGVPHAEVMRQIQQCQFVVNELYSDTLMAGLDTEAAWFNLSCSANKK